nr:mechanosensitive ion channel [Cytophagales bacterium]
METLLENIYFGNTLRAYLIALGGILLGLLLVKVFKRVVLQRLEKVFAKTETNIDDFLLSNFGLFVVPIVYFSIIYMGLKSLVWPANFLAVLEVVYIVIVTYYTVRLISNVLLMLLRSSIRRQEGGEEKVKQMGGLIMIFNGLIWSLGIIFLISNLGYDVSAIIAGLGIGGIAIALAAQNILGDLFNYFVIFFDRPFEIGDFLVVGDKNGIVEKIGIKTTRIKTLSGEQLVVANSDLTSSRIHNFKKMQRRRILFTVGVTYETPPEKLRMIPGILKEIVETASNVDFDRAHFKGFGDSSLDFEIVYHINSPDYNVYMDIQQQYNFLIYERFGEMGISIAFPTRTLYIRNENEMKFKVDVDKQEKLETVEEK